MTDTQTLTTPTEITAEPVVAEAPVVPAEEVTPAETPEAAPVAKTKTARTRGAKYVAARSRVDKTKAYDLTQAIDLVKTMSFTKFDASIEAHLQVREAGAQATVNFPHSTGKTVKAAIVSQEVLENIDKGIIDFDVLIAKPEDMKQLAKYARVLGPKGLMPNPKSGTVTPNPEAKKEALESGAVTVKTERKAPLIHIVVGKVSSKTEDIAANVEALLKAFTGKTVKLSLTATMSPSVRVAIEK